MVFHACAGPQRGRRRARTCARRPEGCRLDRSSVAGRYRDRRFACRSLASNEDHPVVGPVREAAGSGHGFGHGKPDCIGVLARLVDLAEDIERAVGHDISADARSAHHSRCGEFFLNSRLEGRWRQPASCHFADQGHCDAAVVGDQELARELVLAEDRYPDLVAWPEPVLMACFDNVGAVACRQGLRGAGAKQQQAAAAANPVMFFNCMTNAPLLCALS